MELRCQGHLSFFFFWRVEWVSNCAGRKTERLACPSQSRWCAGGSVIGEEVTARPLPCYLGCHIQMTF